MEKTYLEWAEVNTPSHTPVVEPHSPMAFSETKQQEPGRIILPYLKKSLRYLKARPEMRYFASCSIIKFEAQCFPFFFLLFMHTVVHSTHSNALTSNTCDM